MRRRVRDGADRHGLRWGDVLGVSVAGGLLFVAVHSFFTAPATAGRPRPNVERISVSTNGALANAKNELPATNADGSVVAFKSLASNLVEGDANQRVDVFARDRTQGTTERVSVTDIPGTEPDHDSFPPALDHAGRFVAFGSPATLLRGDFNIGADIFVYDRQEATTVALTFVPDQFGDNRGGGRVLALPPSVSADGSLVAFTSSADDLVDTDSNETSDVFVRGREGGAAELISLISSGSQQGRSGNGPSGGPAISADGCLVAFYSDASNLVSGDTNQFRDVFVRDRCNGTTERVSVSSNGEQANRPDRFVLGHEWRSDHRHLSRVHQRRHLVDGRRCRPRDLAQAVDLGQGR